jgi:hypothetical protein
VPADSHDVIWMNLEHSKVRRCGECGSGMSFLGVAYRTVLIFHSVYALDYKGNPDALHGDHAHHH